VKRWISLLLVAVLAVALGTAATHAFGAEEGAGVEAKGACSLGSQWTLHMGTEIGVEFEVAINSGVPDQTWILELHYNKHPLFRGKEMTEDDGGFEVRKVENNAPGVDLAFLRAHNPATGETCAGQLEAEL